MVGSYEGNDSTLRKCLVVFVGKGGTPLCLVFCSHREINDKLVEDHRVVLHRAPPFFLSDQLNTREYTTPVLRTQNRAMSQGLKMITTLLREPNEANLLQISRLPAQKLWRKKPSLLPSIRFRSGLPAVLEKKASFASFHLLFWFLLYARQVTTFEKPGDSPCPLLTVC